MWVIRLSESLTTRKVFIGGYSALSWLLSSFSAVASEETVTAITDADSLRAGELRLRLHGIDAPELRQTCLDKASQPYRCGQEAADFLRSMIDIDAEIQCQHLDTDRYKRWVVKCFHNGEDIGEAVVRTGWAMAYRRYAKDYIEAENQAERAGRGIWQGSFTRPEIWRREQRKK